MEADHGGSGGASARRPPPPPPPPPTPLPPPPLTAGERYNLRLDQFSALTIMLFQLLNVANHWHQLQAERARLYTLLVLACAALGFASTVALPARFYLRHRSLLVPAQRALLLVSPSIRQTGVGTSLLLERQPEEGTRGALRQLLLILTGTKLALPLAQRSAVVLPPLETAAVQAVLVLLTWNPAGYCATSMMRHPLTVSRMRRLAAALDWASLPMLATQSVLAGPGIGMVGVREAGEDALCHTWLTFAGLGMAWMLPVLLSAFHAARLACRERQRADVAVFPEHPPPAGGLRRLLWRAAAAVRAADRGIGRALSARPFRLQRPLLLWWVLSYCWEVSKALATMSVAKRPQQ